MRRIPSVKHAVAVLAVACAVSVAGAEVKLPGVFGDHMVLQRDVAVPVWGWAEPGGEVTVTLAGQSQTAAADKDGKWSLRLNRMPAGGPYTLKVRGSSTLELGDVLVGEVWLCSGQSNMAMAVSGCNQYAEEQAAADLPKIRHFTVPRRNAQAPETTCGGAWTVCSPQTVGKFSGTAYFFGRTLHKELNVPVGLINSSVGGTPIEAWTGPKDSGPLYNGMIAPLAPYAIRGAIWYQGERNAKVGQPEAYAAQLPALIGGWRGVWGQGDFPFLYVQLPNYTQPQQQPVENAGWVQIREAMLKTLAVPNTGMAVTVDLGEAGNIHPKNKQDVGKRLALWALAKTYGRDLVYCGPLYRSMRNEGDKIIVRFDQAGGGLVAKGDQLKGFAIAGADKEFRWADAAIEGDTVVVRSPQVKDPAAVRYAWASNPDGNLYNKAGLPASPFRTDDWELK
jgi:sialate O-acetylesterase